MVFVLVEVVGKNLVIGIGSREHCKARRAKGCDYPRNRYPTELTLIPVYDIPPTNTITLLG